MYYLLFYETVDDYLERRTPFRPEHLNLVREAHERGELVMAGAFAEPADGAAFVFKGKSAEAAERFAQHDPYVLQGLIKRWYVRPWTVVVGGESD
jgi:uncharacterized protein